MSVTLREGHERVRAFLDGLARCERLPAEAIAAMFADYADSVVDFLVVAFEAEGPAGFADAFRLVDVLEGLGCVGLAVADPARVDPVHLFGRGPDGRPFALSVRRATCNLDRVRLGRLLRESLGVDRATAAFAVVRAARAERACRVWGRVGGTEDAA